MTLREYIAKLRNVQASLEAGGEGLNVVMRECCFGALAEVRTRIHEQGLAADGSKIGSYNTTNAIYVNPENSPQQFTPLGKGQKRATKITLGNVDKRKDERVSAKGANKDSIRKTKYFESYDAFKTAIGRNELGSVNLFLFGGLSNQLSVIANGNGYGIGWIPGEVEPEGKKKPTSYLLRANALELKYGKKIWGLSDAEKKHAINAGQLALNKYLKDALR